MKGQFIAGAFTLAILSGCVNTKQQAYENDVIETGRPNQHTGVYTMPPPKPRDYGRMDETIVLHQYATDLNWYMFYMFSYTRVLNQYALSKGWVPPETAPLCKTFAWPRLKGMPKFDYDEGDNLGKLEYELAAYITKLKAAYKGEQIKFEEAELWQERFCMY